MCAHIYYHPTLLEDRDCGIFRAFIVLFLSCSDFLGYPFYGLLATGLTPWRVLDIYDPGNTANVPSIVVQRAHQYTLKEESALKSSNLNQFKLSANAAKTIIS